jgi:hypothetical protein
MQMQIRWDLCSLSAAAFPAKYNFGTGMMESKGPWQKKMCIAGINP